MASRTSQAELQQTLRMRSEKVQGEEKWLKRHLTSAQNFYYYSIQIILITLQGLQQLPYYIMRKRTYYMKNMHRVPILDGQINKQNGNIIYEIKQKFIFLLMTSPEMLQAKQRQGVGMAHIKQVDDHTVIFNDWFLRSVCY